MIQLLDTTLRDGSYVIDFRFSLRDIFVIAQGLDRAGIPLIEVGHGLGLSAGEDPRHPSPLKDTDVMATVREAVRSGRWGFFCIPGIARLEDIATAAANGCGFIRIGVDITDTAPAFPFIERVKRSGMLVSVNLMKSYALERGAVPAVARDLAAAGADVIAIVDSAGTMTPDDVAAYLGAVAETSDVTRGFHGHDNLGLATANCLRAALAGAAIVDGSLRGLARSAGNAATEALALLFGRIGLAGGIDAYGLMDVAERMIDPLLRLPGADRSVQLVSGIAGFHSSHEAMVRAEAVRAGVDIRRLIPKVADVSRASASSESVRTAADALAADGAARARPAPVLPTFHAYLPASGGLDVQLRSVLRQARSMASKLGKTFVFNLVQGWRPEGHSFVSAVLQDAPDAVIASAEMRSPSQAQDAAVVAAAEGCDLLLLDTDRKTPESEQLVAAAEAAFPGEILPYGDLDVLVRAAEDYLTHLRPSLRSLALVGDGPLREACHRRFAGGALDLVPETALGDGTRKAEALICCGPCRDGAVDWIEDGGLLLDAYVGALTAQGYQRAKRRGIEPVRVDMHIALHAELATRRRMRVRIGCDLGEGRIAGIAIAAGGEIAPAGTVIVDSIGGPSRVLGVADGRGLLRLAADLSDADLAAVRTVEDAIAEGAALTTRRRMPAR